MTYKPFWSALITGGITALATASVAYALPPNSLTLNERGYLAGTAGIACFLTTFGLNSYAGKQVKRSVNELQAQIDAVSQGSFPDQVPVYSKDEIGQMAQKFNQMNDRIETIMRNGYQTKIKPEASNDNIPIPLQVMALEEVITATARGDFTGEIPVELEAELGTVSYCLKLIIGNLREQIKQVKKAAQEVAASLGESETLTRSLAEKLLHQSEAIPNSSHSIQGINETIQQIAQKTREAAELIKPVAGNADSFEEIQQTYKGILETGSAVSENLKKVKEIGVYYQEISHIIDLITYMRSRIDLMAYKTTFESVRMAKKQEVGWISFANALHKLAVQDEFNRLQAMEETLVRMRWEIKAALTEMEAEEKQVFEVANSAIQAKLVLEEMMQVTQQRDLLLQGIAADVAVGSEQARSLMEKIPAVANQVQIDTELSQEMSEKMRNFLGVAKDLQASVDEWKVN